MNPQWNGDAHPLRANCVRDGHFAPSLGLRGLMVGVHVLGCRSNLYEGEAIAGELEARGAKVGDTFDGAQAAVIVSCSVTAAADKKCRQAIRRARREVGGGGIVAVCGCWVQNVPAEEAFGLGADILIGNRAKSALADALEARLTGEGSVAIRLNLENDRRWDSLSLTRPVLRTRAFLKIQEGCDHFCTYCVIPFLRGRSTSRPPAEALAEIRRVTEAGCREVVLTGIHLGVYGRDNGASLAALVREASAVPGLQRLRLGSLEPFTLGEDLLFALAESPVFCPHLHLPLQSGDDLVLERMRRGHGRADFLKICARARAILGEDLHLSSDVLVGFPGEGENAFENTLALMAEAGLGRVHVFPYSPRRGTLAADFPDRVPARVLAERAARAGALGESLLERYASRFVGRRLAVLAEAVDEGRFSGYTPHFVELSCPGRAAVGEEVEVLVRRAAGKLEGVLP